MSCKTVVQWKPDGDDNREYYRVYINKETNVVGISEKEIWENGNSENEAYEEGLIFKTKELAGAKAKELRRALNNPIKLLGKIPNIFGDDIAYVEHWDFSEANINEDARIMAITNVASICYQSPKALGSESLYNRLAAESQGLPSSSFEFVPVLLSDKEYWERVETQLPDGFINNPLTKYGEWIMDGKYLLTNYRAIYSLNEKYGINLTEFFNTKEECAIMKKYQNTFLFKIDLPTRTQMIRHRAILQELSRRYVSGKRVPVDHYISEDMKNKVSKYKFSVDFRGHSDIKELIDLDISTETVIDICMNHYFTLLEQGVKPQNARRIIPQTAYSNLWMSFQPFVLDNYLSLRDDIHAQWEIRQTAIAMKKLIAEKDAKLAKEAKGSNEK